MRRGLKMKPTPKLTGMSPHTKKIKSAIVPLSLKRVIGKRREKLRVIFSCASFRPKLGRTYEKKFRLD